MCWGMRVCGDLIRMRKNAWPIIIMVCQARSLNVHVDDNDDDGDHHHLFLLTSRQPHRVTQDRPFNSRSRVVSDS